MLTSERRVDRFACLAPPDREPSGPVRRVAGSAVRVLELPAPPCGARMVRDDEVRPMRSDRFGPKSRVIRIDPNAYEVLIRCRKKDETLSDVIRRLAAGRV